MPLLKRRDTGLDAKPSAVFSLDAKAKRKLRKWNQNLQGLALRVQRVMR
jgi:hypothetical protein